jgi:hypothetical protein
MNRLLSSLSARLVRQHLERLGIALHALAQRWREAVVQAIGEAVANAVREIVRWLVRLPVGPHPVSRPPDEAWEEGEARGDDPYRHPWDVDEDVWQSTVATVVHPDELEPLPRPSRWYRATAAGLEAAAWWLRRQACWCPILGSMVLGLATAGAAFTAGPAVVLGGAGLLGSALGLMRLAHGVE